MICKRRGGGTVTGYLLILGVILTLCPVRSTAQEDASEVTTWTVPIVMEEATVRGKVAVLENRTEDRQVLEGLKVEIWSTEMEQRHDPAKKRWFKFRKDPEPQLLRKDKVHETETDADGLFSLPTLKPEEYYMVLGEIQFRITVIPKDKIRAGSDEPKVLLILIPKEVVEDTK